MIVPVGPFFLSIPCLPFSKFFSAVDLALPFVSFKFRMEPFCLKVPAVAKQYLLPFPCSLVAMTLLIAGSSGWKQFYSSNKGLKANTVLTKNCSLILRVSVVVDYTSHASNFL